MTRVTRFTLPPADWRTRPAGPTQMSTVQKSPSAHLVATALVVSLSGAVFGPRPAAAQDVAPGSTLTFGGLADALDVGAAGVVLTFGSAATGSGNTGSFASVAGGTALTIRGLTVGEGPQSVAGLFTAGGYTFHLTELPSGRWFDYAQCYGAPAAGQRCSPIQTPGTAISPFELENLPTGVDSMPIYSTASFRLVGTVTGPDGGPASAFTGTIASVLPASFQYVLGGLEEAAKYGAGLSGLQYQAEFVVGPAVTTTPEPTALAAVGAGLVALAGAARRRRARGRP